MSENETPRQWYEKNACKKLAANHIKNICFLFKKEIKEINVPDPLRNSKSWKYENVYAISSGVLLNGDFSNETYFSPVSLDNEFYNHKHYVIIFHSKCFELMAGEDFMEENQ